MDNIVIYKEDYERDRKDLSGLKFNSDVNCDYSATDKRSTGYNRYENCKPDTGRRGQGQAYP